VYFTKEETLSFIAFNMFKLKKCHTDGKLKPNSSSLSHRGHVDPQKSMRATQLNS